MSNAKAANHWRAIEEEKLRKRIAELEAENALEKKRNRELEAENLSFARECNLVADEKKELKEENQRLRDEIQSAIYAMSCPISASGSGALAILRKALLGGGDE